MIPSYGKVLKRLSEIKKVEIERRPLTEKVFQEFEETEHPFFIVRAPTGYGKTVISFTFAYHSLKDASRYDRVIHVLPMRSIIEDIDKTAKEVLGFSRTKMMGSSEEFMHLFPLNITTVDTFIWDIIKLNTKKLSAIRRRREYGYDYLTQASILTSLVIFDEAHFVLDNPRMKGVFLEVLKFLSRNRVPVIFLTATLSRGYIELLKRYDAVSVKTFDVQKEDPFYRRESEKSFDLRLVPGEHIDYVDEGSRNIIIANTVSRAVEVYRKAKEKGLQNTLLLHGRMTPTHKKKILETLRFWKNEKEFLLVTTQVVEAGVDISSDNLITDLAPANSLIQRFGRVARYSEKFGNIIIVRDVEDWPYERTLLMKTERVLTERLEDLHPRLPETYQEIIDEVHGKTRIEAEKGSNLAYKRIVRKALEDPAYRSDSVIKGIERKIRDTSQTFLRDLMIPLEVEGEVVLLSPSKAYELWTQDGITVLQEDKELENIERWSVYKLAIDIALGKKKIVVKYKKEYDHEMGII